MEWAIALLTLQRECKYEYIVDVVYMLAGCGLGDTHFSKTHSKLVAMGLLRHAC